MDESAWDEQQNQIRNLLLNIDQFCTRQNDYVVELCQTARDIKDGIIALGIAKVFINRLSRHIRESRTFLNRIDALKTTIDSLKNLELKRKLLNEFSKQISRREDILRLQMRTYAIQQKRIHSLYSNLQARANPSGETPEIETRQHTPAETCRKKNINWTGSNKLDILALFELLENAGLIAPGSCKNAGSIISATFQKDGKEISRGYINNKKRDPIKYLKRRLNLMEKIITGLDTAYDKLSKLEENNDAPDYLID